MFNSQFFTRASSSNPSEFARKAALYCIDPNLPNFDYVMTKTENWAVFVFQALLEITKTERLSLDEIDLVFRTFKEYAIAISEGKELRLLNQFKCNFNHPKKIQDFVVRFDYKCDSTLNAVDQLKVFTILVDSMLQSWLQNKFNNNPLLISKLESGRLELSKRVHDKISKEQPWALFLIDSLEREHNKGMF